MSIFDDDNFDADASRFERDNRMNQPDFAPSQDPMGGGDIFNQGSIFNQPMGGGMDNGGLNNGLGGGIFDNNAMGGSSILGSAGPTPQQKSEEEVFFDTVGKGAKSTVGFFKELSQSFGEVTPMFWQSWGWNSTKLSVGVLILGVIMMIFGRSAGVDLAIGGCISGAVGFFVMLSTTEKSKECKAKYKDGGVIQKQPEPIEQDNDFFNQPATEPSFNLFDEDEDFGDEDEDEIDDDFGDEDEAESFDLDNLLGHGEDGENTETALSNLQEIPKGMYTRQYLWDMFIRVLPTMIPEFSSMQTIDEDEDIFIYWSDKIREAAEVSGCNEDYLPELLELKQNLFTFVLTCDRPKGFKPDAVANELANIYGFKDGELNRNVFAKAETVGGNCIITIFTGNSAMISLKDMMLQVQDYFLNSENYIPVVFGTDQLGKVIHYDLKKLESIIITGMPRSGKSWFCQAVLTQMCAFVPPSELQLYICDPKEGISDFKGFVLPHVKKFVSDDKKIVDTLRELVKVEGPRRKKIIGDAGNVNIWDFKKKYPDFDLPVIYAVVDEVVTLASRMDKETNQEFRMLLRELISQLPALGIRAFLIPHVLNNDIIEKKTSDIVPCKISVRGDADHIEKATGSKFKDFPYKLTHNGDMAVKIPDISSATMFVHGPALTDSNVKNNELFDYLRRVWDKLEPEQTGDSIASDIQVDKDNIVLANNVMKEIDNNNVSSKKDTEDELNIFGDDEDIDMDDFFN